MFYSWQYDNLLGGRIKSCILRPSPRPLSLIRWKCAISLHLAIITIASACAQKQPLRPLLGMSCGVCEKLIYLIASGTKWQGNGLCTWRATTNPYKGGQMEKEQSPRKMRQRKTGACKSFPLVEDASTPHYVKTNLKRRRNII